MAKGSPDSPHIIAGPTYWARTMGGKWLKVPPATAKAIVDAPTEVYQNKKNEIAMLAVMPAAYTSKSDVERGLGIVLWTWDLGARDAKSIADQIDKFVADDLKRKEVPAYVGHYFELKRALLLQGKSNPASTSATKRRLMR